MPIWMGTSMASINLGKLFLHVSCVRDVTVTWILKRVFVYLPSFFSQIRTLSIMSIKRFWFSFDLFWISLKPAIVLSLWTKYAVPRQIKPGTPNLRTFAPIVSAHPYCARKFTCHVVHRAFELSTKMNNDRADSVTPTFPFRNRSYLQLSPHCPKMNKKSTWEVKKISRFLSASHRILPSCGCKGAWNCGP